MELDPASVALDRFGHSKENMYAQLSALTGAAQSTIWHQHHSRESIRQKALNQQYLNA